MSISHFLAGMWKVWEMRADENTKYYLDTEGRLVKLLPKVIFTYNLKENYLYFASTAFDYLFYEKNT